MTVYCTNAPGPHETSRLPGFPAGVCSEQMVLLPKAAYFSSRGNSFGPAAEQSPRQVWDCLWAFWQEWEWIRAGAAAWQDSRGPQDRNKAQQAEHNPFPQ